MQSATNRTNLSTNALNTQKVFHSNSTSFLKSPATKPLEAVNAVIKTIASSKTKPPIPSTLLSKKKEVENVLPNVTGISMPNGQPVSQHLIVGTDYRAGRKIGNYYFKGKRYLYNLYRKILGYK